MSVRYKWSEILQSYMFKENLGDFRVEFINKWHINPFIRHTQIASRSQIWNKIKRNKIKKYNGFNNNFKSLKKQFENFEDFILYDLNEDETYCIVIVKPNKKILSKSLEVIYFDETFKAKMKIILGPLNYNIYFLLH